MLIKTLVLNGHGGLLEVDGDVVQLHPCAVFLTVELGHLLPVAVFVFVPDGAGQGQRRLFQRDVQTLREAGLDIDGEDAGEQKGRDDQDQKHGGHAPHRQTQREAHAGGGGIGYLAGGPDGAAHSAAAAPGIKFLKKLLNFVHRGSSSIRRCGVFVCAVE